MATKTIKAWINGAIQEIEVEDIAVSEQPLSVDERVDVLEDKHEVVFTDGNLLVGNGTTELEEMTPNEVLEHINGASVMTLTTEEYEALHEDESNANTLYLLTDSDDRPDWSQTDETAVDYIKNKPDIDGIVDDLNVRIDETNELVANLSNISSTNYDESIIGLSVDGQTITYIKGDGSVHSFTTQDTDTTYSIATDEITGLTKLYATTGSAEDGTMTQKAIKTELDKKVGVKVDDSNDMLIFTI